MRVHHIAFRTRNLPRLADFYASIFGLELIREQAGISMWFRLGATILMLEKAAEDEPGPTLGGLDLVALSVDATQRRAIEDRLRQRGISFEDGTRFTSYFRDPDGRRVGISVFDFQDGSA